MFCQIYGVDEGNRTPALTLARLHSTVKLHPHLVGVPRVELGISPYKGPVMPFNYTPIWWTRGELNPCLDRSTTQTIFIHSLSTIIQHQESVANSAGEVVLYYHLPYKTIGAELYSPILTTRRKYKPL